MTRRALVVSTPTAFASKETGGGLRSIQLENILKSLNFEVEHISSDSVISSDFFDLICVVSFANAGLLRQFRKRCKFLWYDATDSWRITRNSLFFLNPAKETLRLIRDIYNSKVHNQADLVTYCTLRDMEADHVSGNNCLIIPNRIEAFEVRRDFGFRFVFIGPYTYTPNRIAIHFLMETMRATELCNATLDIYSSGASHLSPARNVRFHPSTSNEDLYGLNDVHLVPLMHGAGMKYKTLVPLSLGLQVISTPEGAVGFARTANLHTVSNLAAFTDMMKKVANSYGHKNEAFPSSAGVAYLNDETEGCFKIIAAGT